MARFSFDSLLTIHARAYRPRSSAGSCELVKFNGQSREHPLAPNVVVLSPIQMATPIVNCPVALIVSADRQVRRLISASLGQIGCTSLDVATGREGFACAGAAHVDLVIVDVCV